MHFKTHLAAAIAAALAITAHAAPRWDDKALATARTKAEADIDQYLQKGSGPVAKLANDDIRTWLASATASAKLPVIFSSAVRKRLPKACPLKLPSSKR